MAIVFGRAKHNGGPLNGQLKLNIMKITDNGLVWWQELEGCIQYRRGLF
jgi:hypothetical protein